MFCMTIRQSIWLCTKIYTRNLRNGRRLIPTTPNPGLDHRISAFTKEGVKIEDRDIEEFIEGSESDFYDVGGSLDDHVHEQRANKKQLKQFIVKDKYFKDSTPNLLTWSEKEQIRHLATTNPKEWSPERIAESFPVTVPVVKKLLKYPWKPASEKRISRHDATAMRNWRELKEGILDIPEELREHMLKFANRVIPPLKTTFSKIDLTQDGKIGEFEEIIRRCAESNETPKAKEYNPSSQNSDFNKHHSNKKDKQFMTLEELTTNIKNRLQSRSNVNMPDKILVDTINSSISNNEANICKEIIVSDNTNTENKVSKYKQEEKVVSPINYLERIRIPKQAYKRGATYKVNDCYYDHDGKFLYRVLGMSN